jgi:pyridoxamine 5'-phosphate oxidase
MVKFLNYKKCEIKTETSIFKNSCNSWQKIKPLKMKDLQNYRKSYDKNQLLEIDLPQNPIDLFQKWFAEVEQQGGIEEVNAMSIASIGLDNFPKTRVVLLKQVIDEGFLFYTNYNSEKGQAISNNPNVCLSFFWPNLERQVIIKGVACRVSSEVSDQYFLSRPIGSQLGAIVSNQSTIIESREILEQKLTTLTTEFESKTPTRPDNWGGFMVHGISFEFWQGRPNRLHDRIRFSNFNNNAWQIDRLAP